MSSRYLFHCGGASRSRVVFKLGSVGKIDRIVMHGEASNVVVSSDGIDGGGRNRWRRRLSLRRRVRKIVMIDSGYDGLGDGHLASRRLIRDPITSFDDIGSHNPAAIFQDNRICTYGGNREHEKRCDEWRLTHIIILARPSV